MKSFFLKIYEINIIISSDNDFVFKNLQKDFIFYLNEKEKDCFFSEISINIFKEKPPYHKVPCLEASLYNHGSICYRDKDLHYIDYSGKGLMIYDFKKEQAYIYSEDENLLYEKARLALLSRVGELLDKRYIHRVHAVGFVRGNRATICLLPMEGGKTTLAINILKKDKRIKLISDDVCFMDFRSYVYPFILRIGARGKNLVSEIPKAYITKINRNFYGEKFLIDINYFKDRIAEKSKVSNILIGKRTFQEETEIEKISKIKCFIPFIQSGIFGLGLPQIVELFLRGGFLDTLKKINLVFSRSLLFFIAVYRAKTYEIRIGRNLESSIEELINFINEK